MLATSSAYDPDLLDPQHFGFLDPDPQNNAMGDIPNKIIKKLFALQTQTQTAEKRRVIKNIISLNDY